MSWVAVGSWASSAMAAIGNWTLGQWVLAASMVYQQVAAADARSRQSQARDKAAVAAEEAKGTKIVVEEQAMPLKILYGRNLVGGLRVFTGTYNAYDYADPAAGGVVFSASTTEVILPLVGEMTAGALTAAAQLKINATVVDAKGEVTGSAFLYKDLALGFRISGTVASSAKVDNAAVSVIAAGTAIYPATTSTPIIGYDGEANPSVLNPFEFVLGPGQTLLDPYPVLVADASIRSSETADSMRVDNATLNKYHRYLLTQQAIGYGGINACYSINIDDRKLIGETFNMYNTVVYPNSAAPDILKGMPVQETGMFAGFVKPSLVKHLFDTEEYKKIVNGGIPNVNPELDEGGVQHENPYANTCVVHFYANGGTPDPLMTATDAGRTDSKFIDVSYATSAFFYDRESPKYNGGSAPKTQFFIEGLKIKSIIGGKGSRSLSTTKSYSNNPALCLLDYLLSPIYGKGLQLSEIDLESFYQAAKICDRVVRPDVPLEGAIWRTKGGKRDVKIYECNLALSSADSMRKNIETLLETMNDAELLWVGGVYKLSVKYPMIYIDYPEPSFAMDDVVQVAEVDGTDSLYRSLIDGNSAYPTVGASWESAINGILTDADIIREGETSTSWPNASTKYNYCTVRFLNEAKDFEEDSVYWPPKNDSLNPVYATYLAQDSGLELSTDVFATGVTSYYNALAKAEFIVRNSRNAITYSINVARDFIHLEPGDIIKVYSDVLGIPGELLRINGVEPDEKGTIKLAATKYDAYALAWNMKDDEAGTDRNIYNTDLKQALNLKWHIRTVSENDNSTNKSYGELSWEAPEDPRITGYHVGYTMTPVAKVVKGTLYTLLGETSTTHMLSGSELPEGTYTVGVVSHDAGGRIAPERGRSSRWPLLSITINLLPQITGLHFDPWNDPDEIEAANNLPFKSPGRIRWDRSSSTRVVDYMVGYTSMTKAQFEGGPNGPDADNKWPAALNTVEKRYPVKEVVTDNFIVLPEMPPGSYTIGVTGRDAKGSTSNEWASPEDHFTVITVIIGRPLQARDLTYTAFTTAAEKSQYPNKLGKLTWTAPPAAVGGTAAADYLVGYTPMTVAQFEGGPDTDATEDAAHWPPTLDTVAKRYPMFEVVVGTSFLVPDTFADGVYTVGVASRSADGSTAAEWDASLSVEERHWPVIAIRKGDVPQVTDFVFTEAADPISPILGRLSWKKPSGVAYATLGYAKMPNGDPVADTLEAYTALLAKLEGQIDVSATQFDVPYPPPGYYVAGALARDSSGQAAPLWSATSKMPLQYKTVTAGSILISDFHYNTIAERIASGGAYGYLQWTLSSPPASFKQYRIILQVFTGGAWVTLSELRQTATRLNVQEPPVGTYQALIAGLDGNDNVVAPEVAKGLIVHPLPPPRLPAFDEYTAEEKMANGGSAGKLTWLAPLPETPGSSSVVDYIVGYKIRTGAPGSYVYTDWLAWDSTTFLYYQAPNAPNAYYILGVASRNKEGVISEIIETGVDLKNGDFLEITEHFYDEQRAAEAPDANVANIEIPVGQYGLAYLKATASITGVVGSLTTSLAFVVRFRAPGSPTETIIASALASVSKTVTGTLSSPAFGTLETSYTLTQVDAGTYTVTADVTTSGSFTFVSFSNRLDITLTRKKLGT